MSSVYSDARARAVDLLKAHPDGLRFNELLAQLHSDLPHAPMVLLRREICALPERCPDVQRPRRGLYVHVADGAAREIDLDARPWPSAEWRFYDSFARWLGELEGCARCIKVGGNALGAGTPDVLGRCTAPPGAIVPYPDTLIAGELKVTRERLSLAVAQAFTYKLFAHKSYLAVPADAPASELRRVESLCVMGQVGLVLFDAGSPADPRWELRLRPQAGVPDMAQLNEKLALLKDELF